MRYKETNTEAAQRVDAMIQATEVIDNFLAKSVKHSNNSKIVDRII